MTQADKQGILATVSVWLDDQDRPETHGELTLLHYHGDWRVTAKRGLTVILDSRTGRGVSQQGGARALVYGITEWHEET